MNNTYFFPFEGEKHLGTIVLLPYRSDTWASKGKRALKEYFEVVRSISKYERVFLIHYSIEEGDLKPFKELNNVTLLNIPYDDSWARDNTPLFLIDKDDNILGVNFGFNSWGGSYDGLYTSYDNDNALSHNILKALQIEEKARKDFILEGGSVHFNGKGVLLTTEECLLSKGRNPSLNKDQITEVLKEELNVKKIIYLPYGIYNDETNGHIDNIACFLSEHDILLATSSNKNDPQYERSRIDEEILRKECDCENNKFNIYTLPVPEPYIYMTKEESERIDLAPSAISRLEGRRLAASYVNFYLSDKFALIPQFGVKEDKIAYDFFKKYYKDRDIIPIYSKEILLGGGNIHCITKQIPYSKKYKGV